MTREEPFGTVRVDNPANSQEAAIDLGLNINQAYRLDKPLTDDVREMLGQTG